MARRPTTEPLNEKNARFVAEYLKDLNATQAAIRAGYSQRTAKQQGSRLLTKAAIRDAIAKGQQKVARKAEITTDSLTGELEEARTLARKRGQISAMVAATMGKAKITGKVIERHKHSGAIGTYDLSKLSDDDLTTLEAILGRLAVADGDPGGESEA